MSEETPKPESSTPQTPPPADTPSPASTPEPAAAAPAAAPSEFTKEQKDKKLISGLFGILLGALGIHKFYLGYQKEGIIMLVVSIAGWLLCGIPTMVVWVIGLIEGILYLTKTDDEFVSTYVVGRKPWF